VKITLLPSALGEDVDRSLQYLTSFLIDDVLAIDAGCLGFFRAPREQARIKHVLLSHSHIDHLASLPIFLDNAYNETSVVTVYGSEWVLNCLQSDLFNDRIWADFIRLSKKGEGLLNTASLAPLVPVQLDGLTITPVPVDHVVPTFGFLVEDATTGVVISSDTGPTDEIWRRANALINLKAVFLEVAFPNAMANLAAKAKHHTPQSFGDEMRKLRLPVPVFAYHIKARFCQQIAKELHELGLPNLMIAQAEKPYFF
jgi:ribonuclease BN (tRNA processing enzyme)